jgi:glycosyltransferase involved in cell wall biosynthesis
MPEVVLHDESGLLVESENSDGLAEAIVRLLNHPEIALTLGRSARAQEMFSWNRHVDGYDALYRSLVAANVRCPQTIGRAKT